MSHHQDAAKAFLKMAGAGNVQEAYDRYIAPSFTHHNQYFKGDRQSLLISMQEASRTSPNKSIDIKHVYEFNHRLLEGVRRRKAKRCRTQVLQQKEVTNLELDHVCHEYVLAMEAKENLDNDLGAGGRSR